MKRFFLLLVSSCLFSVSLAAQPLVEAGAEATLNNAMRRAVALHIPLLPKVADTGLYSFQISKILETRVWDSFCQACSLQATISECHAMIYGEPAYKFTADPHFSVKTLYPDIFYLNTNKQAARYLVARNNRLFTQEFHRLNNSVWPQLDEKLPALQQAATLLPRPLDPLGWMAEQVSERNPRILFIGEVHDFPEIQQQILTFLLHLRQQDSRPMIILTEFLPEGYEWNMPEKPLLPLEKGYYKQHVDVPQYLQEDYRPIWDTIVPNGFRVIGLESRRVINDESTVTSRIRKNTFAKQEIWTTLEGMQLRNKIWQGIIDKYSRENPDALIIVYTGAAHSLYNAPFSIANGHEKEAFVLAFYPARRVFVKTDNNDKPVAATTSLTDPLERLTNFTQSFPQTVLFLDRPDLARTAGFDGRIKIDVDLTDRLKRLSKFTHGRIEEP